MAKVLLVDDDETLETTLITAFKKSGFEAILAKDGTSGLNMVRKEKPDIILLDQVLPDLSGNEVLKKLKGDTQTQGIPVIMLSNFSQEELVKEAINNGAADYVFKYQIEPEDLINKVKDVLRSKTDNIG